MKTYKSERIYTSNGIVDGYMVVDGNKIVNITTDRMNADYDFSNQIIIPGIIDTHNHAAGGYSPYGINDDERFENNKHYLKNLAATGVTSVLSTLFSTKANQESLDVLKTLANEVVGKDFDGATSVGINFEGPFLNRTGEKGIRYIPDPVDCNYLNKCLEISCGTLLEMGMAPELPNSDKGIALLIQNGIKVAMTHTDAKSEDAFNAFERGVDISTHTCNVMVGIHHRNIGSLGAALMDNRVSCELICDGLHVCNDMLSLIFKLKPHDKIMLVSDSSSYQGYPKGKYSSENETIFVNDEGFVLDENGRLEGSSKPIIYGIKNIVENCQISLDDALRMACYNPAMKFGFNNKGSLETGKDADFVVINDKFDVLYTFNGGKMVFDYEKDVDLLNKKLLACRTDI